MKISSNHLNVAEQSIKLDPKLIKGDSAVRALARLISANVELYRADLILSEIKRYKKSSKPPPAGLLGGVLYPSETTPWYELLTNLEVLKAIVSDTNWELDVLCKGIVRNLKPPNWEVFFWMGEAIKADRDEGRLRRIFLEKNKNHKKISSDAGKKSGEARRNKELHDHVIKQYEKHLREGTEKHLIADKIHKSIPQDKPVTVQHVRRIIRNYKKAKEN